ncbi:hypothetical protein MMT29_23885, partial [Escherichia coli]|nr:hypothetical protein [Escherichia coli]
QSSASSLSSGEYLPGSLQGKISSDGCLKKEQMVVSAIASTPQPQRRVRAVPCLHRSRASAGGMQGKMNRCGHPVPPSRLP